MDIETVAAPPVEPTVASVNMPPEPEILPLRAIVKVFVIESSEGGWIDCGTGDFYLQNVQLEDGTFSLRIRVEDKPDPAETREPIDPVREKKLRGPTGDTKLLVDVPIQDAEEFMRCQSKHLILHSHDCHLGAKKHQRVDSAFIPLCLGMQGVLEVCLPNQRLKFRG